MFDYLIVGSGLYGATFAYFAKQRGKKCLIIEKRSHKGGNIFCENIEGINVHKYGAHIFHTSNKKVWDFVNSIVPFNNFINCPIANYKGELYNLPFNMNTFNRMWGVITPDEAMARIEEQKSYALSNMKAMGIAEPRNLEEQALTLVGKDIYDKLIKGYTEKQWGRPCCELPSFIIKRLPFRLVYDNNYFEDKYQGVPVGGYNGLINGLINGVECLTGVDFFEDRDFWLHHANKIVFTGRIDEFFDYDFGKLDYRTVRFETEILNTSNWQGNAVVNYTDKETPFTRIIEHKHFETSGPGIYDNPKTVISREFSTEWKDGMEPYYPINDTRNSLLFEKYKVAADQLTNVHFGGRLAEYKYYDMAPVIEAVMSRIDEI